MRTTASVGCSMLGSGTVSTRTSRLPCQVTAFMAGLLPARPRAKSGRSAKPGAPSFLSGGSGYSSRVAVLTFDDGPDPRWTPRVLDALAEAGVRATFFVMAGRAREWPELVERAAAEGHEIQLHCLEHVRHTEASRGQVEADTDSALALLEPLSVHPRRWRPPWGACAPWTRDVAGARDLRLAGWTLDTHDWSGFPAEVMLRRSLAAARDDSVVLLHDGLGPGARRDGCKQTADLIVPLVEALHQRGVSCEALGDRPVAPA